MEFRLSEHNSIEILFNELSSDSLNETILLYDAIQSKRFNDSSHCFLFEKKEQGFELKADYCIGLDWLGNTGRYLYVEPKLNTRTSKIFDAITDSEEEILKNDFENIPTEIEELDYLKMLLQVTNVPESNNELKGLVQIDWVAKPVEIQQKDDKLTPFLVVQYLQLVKAIVRKGLKKNYYKVQENLNNRVKGKILVGQHIKQNVFKNRLTNTFCEYQQFGEDHPENRFLKKVLQFASSYIENHEKLFGDKFIELQHTINYCRPAFELISNQVNDYELKHIKHNPFYKDYANAIDLGKMILKRFAYNITQTTKDKVATPPFWIDMPRLFELYTYSKMIEANPNDRKAIHYQFSTHGNFLDILVSKPNFQMVIDAKYKLKYKNGHLHEDIRQVAGYARLNKVRKELNVTDDRNIDCLIIYPDMENGLDVLSIENIKENRLPIKAYYNVYKLGVMLPLI
ncbi:McrBC 5-methylcytosine restriction system component [Flavobacterium aquaticum]|uniref:McrBC 5-methylcytosine restriction system component n=1 Tax=Flavobacterium aquaticum TaxID=1236486 RepID=A0A327YGH9_9FLAO|nr:restriction endonuclease [Flavobacterium aquaticum]RAK19601.1 McrBC 5-methylcytosine restriction system component [Flavobacterium aquaticum]